MKKKIFFIVLILLIVAGISSYFIYKNIEDKNNKIKLEQEEKIKQKEIKDNYNDYIIVKNDTKIYDKKYKEVGTVNKDTYLNLDSNNDNKDGYYKLLNSEYYISYQDVEKVEQKSFNNEYKTYKNYIPYNETIITNDSHSIIFDNEKVITLNKSNEYTVIIKGENKYGVEFNDQLVYINSSDVKEIKPNDNQLDIATDIAVLNYHFAIDTSTDERTECVQTICISTTNLEEQIGYLKENNFYAASMTDLYLFLNDQINLPSKTVVITIDDGWYVSRMMSILEKYEMQGTLFLIGSLAPKDAYLSSYLEVHSHTYDMHTPGVCKGEHGGGILCLSDEEILEDLKKSREELDNSEYFCFPFYEYTEHSIELVKQAGFKMAFVGGNKKTKKGDNLYKVPRYILFNSTTLEEYKKMVN